MLRTTVNNTFVLSELAEERAKHQNAEEQTNAIREAKELQAKCSELLAENAALAGQANHKQKTSFENACTIKDWYST